MSIIQISLLLPLLIFSYLDIKYRKIPSVFLTGLLFVSASINISSMAFGILAFVYAFLLHEFDFIGGRADIKVLTTIGFMLNSLFVLMIFVLLTSIIGAIYKFVIVRITKKDQCAFIPCLTIIYLILLLFI